MKTKEKMKIKRIYFITSILFFGLACGKEQKTVNRENVGDEVYFYNAPNKTEALQIQPRIGESMRVPRQQSKAYQLPRNFYKPPGNTDQNINDQNKRNVQNVLEAPILIYRGPHRPRELYRYRSQTKARREQIPSYIGAASGQVAVRPDKGRNHRSQNSNRSSKRNDKDSFEFNPAESKRPPSLSKKLYEDISILKEPHVESTIGRPMSSIYSVPEKQNYAIYGGGIYGEGDPATESLSSVENDGNDPPSFESKTSFKAALPAPVHDHPSANYGSYESYIHVNTNDKSENPPQRRSSNVNRSRKLYSRNYGLINFTPSILPNSHPAKADSQFEVMDHYDGGFGPKIKRENPSPTYYGTNNFGGEFDYENYDGNSRPVTRLHRASKPEPEFDGDLNFQENSNFGTTYRPPQNSNRNNRRNRNGSQRRRKGPASVTRTIPLKTDYEVQPYQSGTNFQHTTNAKAPQSPSRSSGRKTRVENYDTYATTAAIEDTYANVEIRRTQPKTAPKSSSRSSGQKRRRRTTSRAPNYHQ